MTVHYSANLFLSLFHWKGSVWKTIWIEIVLYFLVYYAIRFGLYFNIEDVFGSTVGDVIRQFCIFTNRLPVEFVLSFYVNQAVNRWWAQISLMPWPDETMAHMCSVLYKNDEDTICRRRTVSRLTIVSIILGYRNVSTHAIKMFPNMEKLHQCGLLTAEETDIIENAPRDVQYELPLQWIHEVVRSKMGSTQGNLLLALNNFRNQLRNMTHYNSVPLPLVYTQTATVAVYGFFLFSLLGDMWYDQNADAFIPFLTILRFIFMVGWLKVAQDIATPFGDDDDDIELTEWLNRHIRFVFTLTDYTMIKMPNEINWTKDESSLSKLLNSFPKTDNVDISDKVVEKFNSILNLKTVTKF